MSIGDGRKTYSDSTLKSMTKDKLIDIIRCLESNLRNAHETNDIQYVKVVQARKHKKKRINKKWLKRYGYKKVIVNSKGWNVKTHTDGTVEFVK